MTTPVHPDRNPSPESLLAQVAACTLCAADLPLPPKPILQWHPDARVLVVGQAPGRRAHDAGIPFSDPSGERLRQWMGVDADTFYDAHQVALLPMGFCYPGTGTGGDLPPRPECAPQWRAPLLAGLPHLQLTLVIGRYAHDWHLPGAAQSTVTATVRNWRATWPDVVPLPHPSPRNNRWLRNNPWFAEEVLPALGARVNAVLEGG